MKVCEKLNAIPGWGETSALLKEKPDAVVICAENARHRDLTVEALEAGAAVLCEKPLATTMEDAEAMLEASRRTGSMLATAFPCRFHPAAVRAKQTVGEGKLGELRGVSATNHGQVPPGWFTDPSLSGGGALMDHTVHVVDLLRWMTGAEVTSVYAEKSRMRPKLAVEDVGIVSLAMANGVVATLDASWSRPRHFPTWGDVTMELIGNGGVLSLDLFAQNHAVYREKIEEGDRGASWVNWGDDMDKGLVADFISAVREGRAPAVSGEDGKRALEVALAAYQSAETGKAVPLPLS
jgi:predicted dehydrogenase